MTGPEGDAGVLVVKPQSESVLCTHGVVERLIKQPGEEFLFVGVVDVGLHRLLPRPVAAPVVPVDGREFRGESPDELPAHPGAVAGVFCDIDCFVRRRPVDRPAPAPPEPEGVYPAGDRILLERQGDGDILVDGERERCRGERDDLSRGERPDGRPQAVALPGERPAVVEVAIALRVAEEPGEVGERVDREPAVPRGFPQVAPPGRREARDLRYRGGGFCLGATVGVELAGLAPRSEVPGHVSRRSGQDAREAVAEELLDHSPVEV